MALVSNVSNAFNPVAALQSIGSRIGNMINVFAEAQLRRDRIMQLLDKSDEELAELGMKREDIVHHVFGDRIFV